MGATPPEDLDLVDQIQITRDAYALLGFEPYRWADNTDDPPSLVAARTPLAESRVVLIASGGVYRHGDVGFTHKDDVTHREIPIDTPTSQLRVTHFAYDQTAAQADPNVVFPIDPLRSMVESGEIGELAEVALTFMGGIYSQRRLHETLVPALIDRVRELEADLALLVPV